MLKEVMEKTMQNQIILTNGTTQYEPITGSHRQIHPALDFTDNLAIVSVSMPSIVTPQGKKQETMFANYAITSGHEIFVCSPSELLKRGFFFAGSLYLAAQRWSYRSIQDFLNNQCQVDPGNLFSAIRKSFEYNLDFIDSRLYSFFPCYVIATYFYPMFPAIAIVFLNGVSGTGKTKIITIIDLLAFNSVNTANISDPSVFRLIQGSRCTLCLDESEKIADPRESAQLINLLLAGVGKGAKAVRSEKTPAGSFVPTFFELQSPKVIANIEGLRLEPLKNRLIPIVTVKPKTKEKANREPDPDYHRWQELRDELYVLTLTRFQEVRQAFGSLPDVGLSGQQLRIWQPVLTIAHFLSNYVGDEVFNDVVSLAQEKAAERAMETAEDTVDMQVLRGIRELTRNNMTASDFYPTGIILSYLQNLPDYDLGSLSSNSLGKMLPRLGLPKPIRETVTGKQQRGFRLDTDLVRELCVRFGVET